LFFLDYFSLKKILIIFFLLGGILISTDYVAQTGGKQREGAATRKRAKFSFKRKKSAGNADKFARSKGRKGLFSRLFKKDQPAWVYRNSGTKKSNWKENRFLFSRHRSQGKIDNGIYQEKEKSKRSRRRDRGNESFSKRKHVKK